MQNYFLNLLNYLISTPKLKEDVVMFAIIIGLNNNVGHVIQSDNMFEVM